MNIPQTKQAIISMPKLILIRHGQSLWNQANRFTGWVDVPLSEKGIHEALAAGKMISDIPIDIIFVSTLMRAQQTAMLTMTHHASDKTPVLIHENDPQHQAWTAIHVETAKDTTIPTYVDWRLNERYYGDLQGANKQAVRDQYGDEQVKIWRRSFDIAPPNGESLAMTAKRTLPYLEERILPCLESGKTVLVSAHGNSLRSIVMSLDNLTKEAVMELEIATGQPIIYEMESSGTLKKLTQNNQ